MYHDILREWLSSRFVCFPWLIFHYPVGQRVSLAKEGERLSGS